MKNPFRSSAFSLTDPSGKLNLFSLALPIFLENIGIQLLSTVSTILISKNPDATAAIGVTSTIYSLMVNSLSIVSLGLTVLIGYALGRGDKKEVRRILGSGLIGNLVFSAVLGGGVALFSPQILRLFYDLEPTVFSLSVDYLRIRSIFLFLPALSNVLLAALRCHGSTGPTAIGGISSNAVIFFLSLYITRQAHFSVSDIVRGMAWAAVASQLTALAIAVLFAVHRLPRPSRITAKTCRSIIKLGFPASLGLLSYCFSGMVTTGIISGLGTDIINTKVYCNNIIAFVPYFSNTLATGFGVMLGRLFGAGKIEEGKELTRRVTILAVSVSCTVSVIAYFLSEPLLRLFTDNPVILSAGRTVFLIDILVETFRPFNHVYANNALVCAKDVVFTAVFGIVACWIFSVGGCRVLAIDCGLGLAGCWFAFGLDELVRAIGHVLRWESGVWKKSVLKD